MGIKADYKLEPCKLIKAEGAVLGLFRFLCFGSCLPVPCPSLGGDKQHVSIFSVCCGGRRRNFNGLLKFMDIKNQI